MDKIEIIETALNYVRLYGEQVLVIKYGGPLMSDPVKRQQFAKNIVLLKHIGIHPVIIHGGGAELQDMLQRLNIEPKFHDDVQIQCDESLPITEMVLSGMINPGIVALINQAGGKAVGLSGKDANLLQAEKLTRRHKDPNSNIEQIINLGHVGETVRVNPHIIEPLIQNGVIPVIAPIGAGKHGQTYILNPDMAAANLAIGLQANKLIYFVDPDPFVSNDAHHFLTVERFQETVPEHLKIVADGAIRALSHKVDSVILLDGLKENALLLELTTDEGCGICIRK